MNSLTKPQAQAQRPFDAEEIGESFEELAVDVVRGETTDFMSRWFRSRVGEADLVIWTDGQQRIIKHQLCLYGQVVEWNPIHGTRTGLVVEEELQNQDVSPTHDADVAETIRFDRDAQSFVIQQAIRVLSRIPQIEDSERAKIIFNLRQSPKMHKSARERALKVWAPKVDELQSTRRPTFWKRLRTWVLGS